MLLKSRAMMNQLGVYQLLHVLSNVLLRVNIALTQRLRAFSSFTQDIQRESRGRKNTQASCFPPRADHGVQRMVMCS